MREPLPKTANILDQIDVALLDEVDPVFVVCDGRWECDCMAVAAAPVESYPAVFVDCSHCGQGALLIYVPGDAS